MKDKQNYNLNKLDSMTVFHLLTPFIEKAGFNWKSSRKDGNVWISKQSKFDLFKQFFMPKKKGGKKSC